MVAERVLLEAIGGILAHRLAQTAGDMLEQECPGDPSHKRCLCRRGNDSKGGDASAVQDQLKNVQQIHATDKASAAILEAGSVVSGGPRNSGYLCGVTRARLAKAKVLRIQATFEAFAAILENGSVVTWGEGRAANSDSVQEQLKNVL